MIRFHNTLSGSLEEFRPINPSEVSMYTCGPTVYDYPHIGNWRAYVFEDLLKRFLLARGFRVKHVMNLTDVDDKTIRGANALGVGLAEYTRKYIEAFFRGLETLNILKADHYPRATEHIPEMTAIIKTLLDKGYAYVKDGSVYFSIARFPSYGRLAKISLEDLKPGSRGDADEYEKESVHDFALWKRAKPGEPFWETELGPGRPGWHIECSAMSSKYLGWTFDIHCGGVDNIFPHHENEIAQSEAASGCKFVNYWLHCHHLVVDGEKMSKSKGNVYTLEALREKGADAMDIRFLLLSTHYRKMLNFTFEALEQARAARQRLCDFLSDLKTASGEGAAGAEVLSLVEKARQGFFEGLSDDLNISAALASIFELVTETNRLKDGGRLSRTGAAAVEEFINEIDDKVLGLKLKGLKPKGLKPENNTHTYKGSIKVTITPEAEYSLEIPDSWIQDRVRAVQEAASRNKNVLTNEEAWPPELSNPFDDLLKAREGARKRKDFKTADAIREALLEAGFVIEDTRAGPRIKWAGPGRP
jgi:cysteinyl-tRNA synthetase